MITTITEFRQAFPVNASKGYGLFRTENNVIHFRFKHGLHEVRRSTGHTEARLAQDKAWDIYKEETGQLGDRPAPARLRNTHATLEEIVLRYHPEYLDKEGAGIAEHAGVGERTARNNLGALAGIVRLVEGFAGEQWRAVRVDKLDADYAKAWRRKRYAAAGRDLDKPSDEDLWLNGTINSTLRQARCVFSRAAWELYQGLKLPPRDSILWTAKSLDEPDNTHQPIPRAVSARMEQLALGALTGQPEPEAPSAAAAVAFELARYCGLTRKEIVHARWSWLTEETGPTMLLYVQPTTEDKEKKIVAFKTKLNAKNREVRVLRERVERWRKALKDETRQADYIIPGENHNQRLELAGKEASQWIAKFLPEREKTLHELRKQAGSDVLARDGDVNKAADFLGDSVNTAKKHYLARTVAAAL